MDTDYYPEAKGIFKTDGGGWFFVPRYARVTD
jgi:hypothetical protein